MPVATAEPTADYVALFVRERGRAPARPAGDRGRRRLDSTDAVPAWDVAGLCRHLLGDDVHTLSHVRDGHVATAPPDGIDEPGFIAWLDDLQVGWVHAARRISPRLVVDLLAWLGPQIATAFEQADARAVTQHVSWASDQLVPMWLETAREVSEHWIHRQQLLTALDRPSDLRADLLGPILDAFHWAYPSRLAVVDAPPGTTVRIAVSGAVERTWWIVAGRGGWDVADAAGAEPVAAVHLDADTAWRLLTNNLRPDARVDVTGDPAIGAVLRRTRAIIGSPG